MTRGYFTKERLTWNDLKKNLTEENLQKDLSHDTDHAFPQFQLMEDRASTW